MDTTRVLKQTVPNRLRCACYDVACPLKHNHRLIPARGGWGKEKRSALLSRDKAIDATADIPGLGFLPPPEDTANTACVKRHTPEGLAMLDGFGQSCLPTGAAVSLSERRPEPCVVRQFAAIEKGCAFRDDSPPLVLTGRWWGHSNSGIITERNLPEPIDPC